MFDKALVRLTKKNRKRTRITHIRNERGDLTIHPMHIKRTIKEDCEQFYAHKFDNIDKMDQFLKRHNLPKLTMKKQTI